MKGRLWAFLPLALLAGLVALSGFMLSQGGARRDAGESRLIGQPFPLAGLTTLDGGTIAHAQFTGAPYLVNAFASWCAPCRVEHPLLVDLAKSGVPIVGLAYKDEPAASAAFLKELGDPYAAVALDLSGDVGLDIGLVGVPETYLVGPDGRIVRLWRGPLTPDLVSRQVKPSIAAAARQGQLD